jgi:hypothetical protein
MLNDLEEIHNAPIDAYRAVTLLSGTDSDALEL